MTTEPIGIARDESWLRELLVRALRKEGLRPICKGEALTPEDFSTKASYVVMSAFVLGMTFTLSDWLNANALGTFGVGAGVLAIMLALYGIATTVGGTHTTFVLASPWLGCVVVQALKDDHDTWATIGLPFVITFTAVTVLQTRRLATVARSAPLVLPVALTVLVIPLFTADLWSTIHRLDAVNLVLVAAVTLFPLLIAVERQLRAKVGSALDRAVAEAAADPTVLRDEITERLARLLDDNERDAARQDIARLLAGFWDPFDPERHVASLDHALRRLLLRNLVNAVVGVWMAATVYIGILTWVLIPVATARDWTGEAVAIQRVAAMGIRVDVPLGPYVTVSILLGLLATAVLLASVAVDDDYADRLADALILQPARAALGPAVPYLRMREATPPAQARQASSVPAIPSSATGRGTHERPQNGKRGASETRRRG